MKTIEILHKSLPQIIMAALLSCIGTYLFVVVGTRTMANAIWLFVLPALIGILLNEGKPKQALMACLLMAVSALSSIALIYAVWGGY
jgi:hypothetical protein